MEKYTAEALLTFTVAGILASVMLPLACVLRWKSPRSKVRGAQERWSGWLILLCILFVMVVLPNVIAGIGSSLGLFRFLDFSDDPNFPLRPTAVVNSVEEWNQITTSLKGSYAALVQVPIVLLAIWLIRKQFNLVAVRSASQKSSLYGMLSEVILCWAIYGLLAIVLNTGVQYLYLLSGWTPKVHPIVAVGIADGTGGWVIGLGACVAAPLFEELIFRRWLMPWAMRRRVRNLWLQLFTLLFSVSAFVVVQRFEVLLVGLFLLLMQAVLFIYPRRLKKIHRLFSSKTFAANWSTSSLFAMLHAAVWPSPVALTVLSMGLGFLVVRTGRWWTAVFCHALFNFTSLLILFASQGMFGPQFKINTP